MSSEEENSQTSSSPPPSSSSSVSPPPSSHFIGKKGDIIRSGYMTKLVDGCRDVLVLYHQGRFHAMDQRCYRKLDYLWQHRPQCSRVKHSPCLFLSFKEMKTFPYSIKSFVGLQHFVKMATNTESLHRQKGDTSQSRGSYHDDLWY